MTAFARILPSLLLALAVLWHHTYLPIHLACHAHYGHTLDLDYGFEHASLSEANTEPHEHDAHEHEHHGEEHGEEHESDGEHHPHPASDHLSGYFSCQAVHISFPITWSPIFQLASPSLPAVASIALQPSKARGPPAAPITYSPTA